MQRSLMNGAILTIALLVFFAIAVPCGAFVCSPLKDTKAENWRRIALVSALDDDGAPRKFPIPYQRHDSWMRLPEGTWGHVFLRRVPETGEIMALETRHQPFGIDVYYSKSDGCYHCRCWGFTFDLNGMPRQQTAPTRGMSALETKVSDGVISIRTLD
jgi:hypothetical protein